MLNVEGFDIHGFSLYHCFYSYMTTEVSTCMCLLIRLLVGVSLLLYQ